MYLEKPGLPTGGDLKARVENIERYLYRLVWELETILETLQSTQKGEKKPK